MSIIWRRAIPAVAGFILLILHTLPAAAAGWYSTGAGRYQYRKLITIDHTKVSGSGDLSNFAVLIFTTDADLKTTANGGKVANSNGYDIIFSSADGITKLDHQIDTYTATTGNYVAWVRIPTLSPSSDTGIYMYFGNSSISTSQENATGVWDSNYKGVWHMKTGSPVDVTDATVNGNNGANTAVTAATGLIGGAGAFVSDNSATITLGASNIYTPLPNTGATESIWVKTSQITGARLFAMQQSAAGTAMGIVSGITALGGDDGIGIPGFWVRDAVNAALISAGSVSIADNQWHYLVLVVKDANVTLYVDGISKATTSSANNANTLNFSASIASIGSRNNTVPFFTGTLDEARFAITNRSDDWIKTEYNNQSSPSTFYSVKAIVQDTSAFFQLFE